MSPGTKKGQSFKNETVLMDSAYVKNPIFPACQPSGSSALQKPKPDFVDDIGPFGLPTRANSFRSLAPSPGEMGKFRAPFDRRLLTIDHCRYFDQGNGNNSLTVHGLKLDVTSIRLRSIRKPRPIRLMRCRMFRCLPSRRSESA